MTLFNEAKIRKALDLVSGRLLSLGLPADMETLAEGGEKTGFFRRDFGMQEWDWPQGVGLYGLLNIMEADSNQTYLDFMQEWYRSNLRRGLPVRNINTTAPLLSLVRLNEIIPDADHTTLCLDWAEWLMKELPRTEEGGFQHVTTAGGNRNALSLHEQQLWIDTLFMAVLFLNRMGQTYEREDWINEGIRQFLMHIKYLWDRKSGLFYHGWTFDGRHNFGEVFWCRGNAWFTLGVPEYLSQCRKPLNEGVRTVLLDTYRAQVKALCALQGESGLWHTVLDDETSYEEVSGSAGIAAGILKGIRLGYLDEQYEKAAARAAAAIMDNIDEDGTVRNVSGGTGVGMNRDHYRNILKAPMAYGQSLVILALAEALRHAV